MTVVHVILSLVEGPQKTGVGQAAASRESSPPYRRVGPARNSQGVSPGLMPNKIQHKHFQLEVEAFEGKWDCQRAETSNSYRKTCWSRNYFPSPRIQPQMSSPLLRHISSSSASRQRARGFLTHMSDLRHNSQFQEQSGSQTFARTRLCTLYYHLKGFTAMILTTLHISLYPWSIICNLASASLVIYFRRTTLNYNCCVGYL